MQRLAARRMTCAASIIWMASCSFGMAAAPAQLFAPAQPPQTEQSPLLAPEDQPKHVVQQTDASPESWQILCRSFEQRAIEYRQFGGGEQQILVVGPLEGDESAGVEVLQRLVDHLERFPRRLTDVTVTVVRDPNPDGRLRGSRTNARGVRLDMNFPTRQWRKVPIADRWLSGRTPKSEPETRALIELLDDLKPQRVVLFEASRRGAELRYSRTAEPIARRMAAECDVPLATWDAAASPASFATYAGNDRNLATLVVRMPAAAGVDYNWTQYNRALLAALDVDTNEREQPRHQLTAFSSGAATEHAEVALAPPVHRGNVLSAKELELGGKLVPVTLPTRTAVNPLDAPAKTSNAAPPSTTATAQQGDSTRRWIVPYRGPAQRGAAHVGQASAFGRPVPYGSAKRLRAPVRVPPGSGSLLSSSKVERLPLVDPTQPPPKPLPQPIPLYPATGY